MREISREAANKLRSVSLFEGCSIKELRTIDRLATPVRALAGETLIHRGDPGHLFFVVTAGEASCRVGETEVARFGPGDFFGEMSLLDGRPRSAEVTAETHLEALTFDREEFFAVLEHLPGVRLKVLGAIAKRLRDANTLAWLRQVADLASC